MSNIIPVSFAIPDEILQELNQFQVIAEICYQLGDSGKGKWSDYFSVWADASWRATGGNNAGHTVEVNGKRSIYHLIPPGIRHDPIGKITGLGNGMVLDLETLVAEIEDAAKDGIQCNHLMISEDAHVTLPYHVQQDRSNDTSLTNGGIGSTGRGIGPTYADKVARKGVMVRDLYKPDALARKIRERLTHYEALRRGDFVRELLGKTSLGVGDILQRLENLNVVISDDERRNLFLRDLQTLAGFYGEIAGREIDVARETRDIMDCLRPLADRIKPYVRDTIAEMHRLIREGKKILIEGAQGFFLSYEFGTYPYVTSSDPSINGTAAGVGISARQIDRVFGVVKFPFMTRVGGGPFPTEIGGRESEAYCAAGIQHDLASELTLYGIPFQKTGQGIAYDHHHPSIISLMNSNSLFWKASGIRLAAEEFGATTGRPRRVGWTDLEMLRHAVAINGPHILLTKPDAIKGIGEFELGAGYRDGEGKARPFSRDCDFLRTASVQYMHFPGFDEDISGVRDFDELPSGIQDGICCLEEYSRGRVHLISTGAETSAVFRR